MLRLNKKTGFTIIEVLCALSIISVFSMIALNIQLNNLRLKKYNDERIRCLTALEAIKQEIVCNAGYSEILSLHNQNKKYINNDKLSVNAIKDMNLPQLFDENVNNLKTYAVMIVTVDEVLKISLELHLIRKLTEEVVRMEFYKGNYI